jgi:hypothetical protein
MSTRRPPAGGAPLRGAGSSGPNRPATPAAGSTPQRPADRYNAPVARRMALAPGLLGAIAVLAGLALLDVSAFIVIKYAAAILAAIVGWFAIQGRAWWALPLLAAVLVIWNPVFPFLWHGQLWVAGQFGAAVVFIVCAILIRVRAKKEDARP